MPKSLLLNQPPWRRGRGDRRLRRVAVTIPTDVPTTAAFFLVLRRMRRPVVMVIIVFALAVFGFTMIPGVDDAGNPYRMSPFDAFYVMSYTAPTIGFGETPYPFTVLQRMWMTVCIFASVTTWAYALGSLLGLLQDSSFRRAVEMQRFRRKVLGMREPFYIIAGYGEAGRTLALALDNVGRRVVVIDEDPDRIDVLTADQMIADVPSINADPRNPGVLGMAGLGHPLCSGVMAMTNDDETNLMVIMSSRLLRPEVDVLSRCSERDNAQRMLDFGPEAVINPYDRHGNYLLLAITRPRTHQLCTWLLNEPGEAMPKLSTELGHGRWLVCADGRFGDEIVHDLTVAGLEVDRDDPDDGLPVMGDYVGFVAGAESDALNLSLAAHARLHNPDLYLSVMQKSVQSAPLLEAFSPDQIFIPTDLVAFEALARVESPLFWGFIEHCQGLDDQAAATVLHDVVERLGELTPHASKITINWRESPAVVRWLDQGEALTLGQLLGDPDDRDRPIEVWPSVVVRGDRTIYCPPLDTPLLKYDQVGILSTPRGRDLLSHNRYHDAAIEYLATGRDVPTTWAWRMLRGHHRKG